MTVDWDKKSTIHLKLILGSLQRYQPHAKTEREKARTKRHIAEIIKVLNKRE